MVTVQTHLKFEVFFAVFREKPEFYGENPIAKRFGMGFSQVTVHALDRACTVTKRESRKYSAFQAGVQPASLISRTRLSNIGCNLRKTYSAIRNVVFLLKRFLPFYPDFVLKSTQKAPENALIRKVNGKVWSVRMIYSVSSFVFLYYNH